MMAPHKKMRPIDGTEKLRTYDCPLLKNYCGPSGFLAPVGGTQPSLCPKLERDLRPIDGTKIASSDQ